MFFNNFKKIFNLLVSKKLLKYPKIRTRILFTISLLLLDVAATGAITYSYKIIVHNLSLNVLDNIWINIWLLGICWILTKTIYHIQEIIFFPVINLTIKEVTYQVVEHLHNIPLSYYQELSMQKVINRIRRIGTSARSFIKTLILTIIPTIIKLIITIIIAVNMGLYGLLLIPTLLIGSIFLYNGIKWYTLARKRAWHATDKVIARISDSILNTKMIRNFTSTEMQLLENLLNLEAQCWNKTNNKLHWIHIKVFTILGISTICILTGVIYSIKHAKLAMADFVFLKAQLLSVFAPFKSFMIECRQIAEATVDLKKIIEIMEIPTTPKSDCIYVNYNHLHQIVCLDNISFAYNKTNFILKNFNFSVMPGEKIVITGKNGSGKSTIINLIAGIYQPYIGKVLVNGRNIQTFTKRQLSKKIYCIQQDFKLFNHSILYNITYGINQLDSRILFKLLSKFKFMDFINKLPAGINTIVGDMGTNLSTGERQKIAIFRSFLINPELLLLDETTNSINYEDEKEILQQLYSYIPSIIMVSHRSNLFNLSHRIINIDQIMNKPISANLINPQQIPI